MKSQDRSLEQVLGPTVVLGIISWIGVIALLKLL